MNSGTTAQELQTKLKSLELKIQELECKNSEMTLYCQLFNESLDSVCIIDGNDNFKYVNPAFAQLFGISTESLISHSFFDNIHTEDFERTKEELKSTRLNGIGTLKFENRFKDKDGKTVYLEWNSSFDKENQLIHSIGRDITSKRNIEEQLIRSEQLMRAAQKIAKLGSWSFTLANNEVYWSDELYNIFEINKDVENLYGEYLSKFNQLDLEILNTNVSKAVMEAVPYFFQHAINLSDGRIKWAYCSGNPVKDENGNVVKIEGFVQDITEQKKSQQTNLNNIREKEILLQELHHRVKNNMQVITSILSLQANFTSEPNTKKILMDSQQRIKSMAAVHDLLYRSKNLSEINFSEYIKSLITDILYSYKGDDHKIEVFFEIPEISFNLDKAVPIGLFVNEIITNSLKHGFKEKTQGLIKVSIKPQEYTGYLLEISDNGVGFDSLHNKKDKTLGLMLIENLAEQVDGKLNCKSNQDGTRYSLVF